MNKQRSIQQNLRLLVGVGIVLITGILITYSSIETRKKSANAAEKLAAEAARNYAGQVKSRLEIALDESRALVQSLSAIKAADSLNLSRRQVNAMLESFLRKNEDFLGVYTGWEPNAFDGQDEKYSNTPGHAYLYANVAFLRFFQLEESIHPQYGGTGLGQSICKSLVEMMGGQIKVRSVYGKGFVFYFTLPRHRLKKQTRAKTMKTKPNQSYLNALANQA